MFFSTQSVASRQMLAPLYLALPHCRSWLMGGSVGTVYRRQASRTISKSTSVSPWGKMPPVVATTTQRWMGSKPGSPGSMPGEIAIRNEQNVLTDIDEEILRAALSLIRKEIGYETYDVSLVLTDDVTMQKLNLEYRGVDAPTDILSFQMHEPVSPGVLQEPEFDIPDYYDLGEIFVDVPYVIRRMEEDRIENEKNVSKSNADENDPEYEVGEEGVSGAMSTVYDPEFRIHLLLVHGMLHLVGYDHEEDEDYDLMVAREEEVMEKLGFLIDDDSDDEHTEKK